MGHGQGQDPPFTNDHDQITHHAMIETHMSGWGQDPTIAARTGMVLLLLMLMLLLLVELLHEPIEFGGWLNRRRLVGWLNRR